MIQLNLDALTPAFADAARNALSFLQLEEGEHGIPVITELAKDCPEVYFSNNGAMIIACQSTEEFLWGLSRTEALVNTGIPMKKDSLS